ncbi:anti-sigma factor [Edaphobacter albus]|uniref:hypothetical protein n=1 Tax=Edaphobacter sp. 4G125 TaxID=2763071 RepID=UPI001645E96B|nr:hypothetical protein [Edaphobacter sp. 4G125]QNI38043.1 hypothetical protein H7846_07235 [Edaphobacter sp. 4G125]
MTSHHSKSNSLSCAEFQEQLPDLFAANPAGITENPTLHEHLTTCENCSALVRDLQYIADQARQLLQPTHEPSDNVWKRIQQGIEAEGQDYAVKSGEK